MAKAMPRRVVLLTGAAGGIGSQTARRLVEAGHRVALVDIDGPGIDRLSAELGDQTLAIEADVTSTPISSAPWRRQRRVLGDSTRRSPTRASRSSGRSAPCPSTDVERVIDVDLLGVWKTVRAALPEVVRSRGYILVVSSVSGRDSRPVQRPRQCGEGRRCRDGQDAAARGSRIWRAGRHRLLRRHRNRSGPAAPSRNPQWPRDGPSTGEDAHPDPSITRCRPVG